jgi:hypothetical protein
MKRIILMLTLCLSLFSLRGFASDIEVSDAALSSFKTSFANATEVSWTAYNDYYRVSFFVEEEYIIAYYDKDGQRIAMTRNISLKQLPLSLQVTLKNEYNNYWITDMFEVNNTEQGIVYYVTIENADSKIVLKSEYPTGWTTFRKNSK